MVAVVLGAACGNEPGGPGLIPDIALDTVLTGLDHPLYVTPPPGDHNRLFVVERPGTIRIIKSGVLQATPFLDITALSRFHVASATADTAFAAEDTLLTIQQPGGDHNGGMLAYGQDSYLYLSVGDGGCCGDPSGHGQDRTELLGSILRLNVGVTGPYQIPTTNPWATDTVIRHEVWNYGLPNPFRFSFDRQTGDMYVGDVGDNTREEIDFLPYTSIGGENLGWRLMEGKQCFGGGTYFYLDYCAAWVEAFRLPGILSSMRRYTWFDSNEFPNSFGEDAGGELYITSKSGNVFTVVPKTP